HETLPGRQRQRLALRHGGAQVHAGGLIGLVGGQRQAFAVRQALDRDDGMTGLDHLNSSAMRRARRRATSDLSIRSQRSTPAAVTMATALSPPPMVPGIETSLATIQSQPFLASLACA